MFTTWDPILTWASSREKEEDQRTGAYHILKVDAYHLTPCTHLCSNQRNRKKTREVTRITFSKLMFTTWDLALTCASNIEQEEDQRIEPHPILKVDFYHLYPALTWDSTRGKEKDQRTDADVYRLEGLLQERYKIQLFTQSPSFDIQVSLHMIQLAEWQLMAKQLLPGQPILIYSLQLNCPFIYPPPDQNSFTRRSSTLLTSLWF